MRVEFPLQQGQCALLFTDEMGIVLRVEGGVDGKWLVRGEERFVVYPSLDEARAAARTVVDSMPSVISVIVDSAGVEIEQIRGSAVGRRVPPPRRWWQFWR